jgi:hypothetical protein
MTSSLSSPLHHDWDIQRSRARASRPSRNTSLATIATIHNPATKPVPFPPLGRFRHMSQCITRPWGFALTPVPTPFTNAFLLTSFGDRHAALHMDPNTLIDQPHSAHAPFAHPSTAFHICPVILLVMVDLTVTESSSRWTYRYPPEVRHSSLVGNQYLQDGICDITSRTLCNNHTPGHRSPSMSSRSLLPLHHRPIPIPGARCRSPSRVTASSPQFAAFQSGPAHGL